jgi:dihydroneopterin aldolase
LIHLSFINELINNYLFICNKKQITMQDKIILENIRVYAYHGCLDEETKIGSDYRVDMTVYASLERSAETDDLSDTVDYVNLNKIVKDEMAIPSKLLEHVAERINKRVISEHQLVVGVLTKVSKLNPPIIGDVQAVCVEMQKKRS